MAKAGKSKQQKQAKADAGKAGGGRNPEILVGENKKARFHYEIVERYECGLVLRGTEVKSLRQGKITLAESYARIDGDELWLIGANIPEYSHGNIQNHEPTRRRKCLLHRSELDKIKSKALIQGMTLVPLRVYFGSKGYAKITIGVGRGRKTEDKRQYLKEKDDRREMRER
ncbi:MAG: SsrA-binding protein SmpB [Planctomycetes bacterium]|nr:SsrA-binding protein SmpB [Planctomycetota bacterium]